MCDFCRAWRFGSAATDGSNTVNRMTDLPRASDHHLSTISTEEGSMKVPGLVLTLSFGVFAAGATHATKEASGAAASEASIPFVQYGGIRNWKADRNHGLWIQDARRNWYYAKFIIAASASTLPMSLGFDARPMGTFDRFSSVLVPHGRRRCVVRSVVASEGPPRKHKGSVVLRPGNAHSERRLAG